MRAARRIRECAADRRIREWAARRNWAVTAVVSTDGCSPRRANRWSVPAAGWPAGSASLEPDDAERKAIIGITGVHQPAGTKRLTVPLADLDAALSRATGLSLAAALAAVRRPAGQPARKDRSVGYGPRRADRGRRGEPVARILRLVSQVAGRPAAGRHAHPAGESG